MVSPIAANTFGFTEIPPQATSTRAIDHSGLEVDFTSGTTLWEDYHGGAFCDARHAPEYQTEFWGSVPAASTPQVVLDMGEVDTWDRMAFFNEEHTGFGAGPLVLEYGATSIGPWTSIGTWWLTDNPVDSAYTPDVLAFPTPVTTRYFRLGTTAPSTPATVQVSIGEVILGTAAAAPPTGPCLQSALVGVPEHATAPHIVRMMRQGGDMLLVLASGSNLRSLHCVDAMGRTIPWTLTGDHVRLTGLASGSYAYVLVATSGAVVRGRFVM